MPGKVLTTKGTIPDWAMKVEDAASERQADWLMRSYSRSVSRGRDASRLTVGYQEHDMDQVGPKGEMLPLDFSNRRG